MRKKIIGAIAIFAIAAVAAFNVNIDTQDESLSAIGLENVEALAAGESGTNRWIRYYRDAEPGYAPGYNCTPGGSSSC